MLDRFTICSIISMELQTTRSLSALKLWVSICHKFLCVRLGKKYAWTIFDLRSCCRRLQRGWNGGKEGNICIVISHWLSIHLNCHHHFCRFHFQTILVIDYSCKKRHLTSIVYWHLYWMGLSVRVRFWMRGPKCKPMVGPDPFGS